MKISIIDREGNKHILEADNNSTLMEVIRDKIRGYMNDIADHMAGGGCQDYEEYIRLVGKVEALALIERDILDIEKRLEEA